MEKVKQAYKKGAQGLANVVVNAEKELVRVSFIDGENAEETFKIDLDECPESVKTGRFFVALSGKGDSIWSIRPAVGTFIVLFQKWGRKDGTVATPREVMGKFGMYQTMTAILKIIKGEMKGMEIPLNLAYKFVDDNSGNVAVPTSDKSGTAAEKLINFLEATGIWDEVLPFTDNLLPMLEKKITKKNRPFSVVVKAGYIDYISSLEGVEVSPDPDDEPGEDATDPEDADDDPDEKEDQEQAEKPNATASGAKGKKIKPDVDEE